MAKVLVKLPYFPGRPADAPDNLAFPGATFLARDDGYLWLTSAADRSPVGIFPPHGWDGAWYVEDAAEAAAPDGEG